MTAFKHLNTGVVCSCDQIGAPMHNLVAVFKHHFCHLTEIKPYQKWTECTAECSLYLHKIDNGEQFSVFTF